MTRTGKMPLTGDGTRRRLALASPRTATILGVVLLVLMALSIPLAGLLHQLTILNIGPNIPFALAFAGVGVVVARRQPRNPIGWILVIFVVLIALSTDGGYYAVAAFSPDHRGLPLAAVAVLLKPLWVPAAAMFPLVILLFPDGRLTSRRWRWVLWAYAGLFGCVLAVIFARTIAAVAGHDIRLDSSGDVTTAGPPAGAAASAATVLVLVSIGVICLSFVAHQVLSWRRAAGEHRQQLKWLAWGSVIALVCGVVGSTANSAAVGAVILGAAALPVSIGIGILKYRLYDIDVVISRTIVYGSLAAFITAVYVGVVVGIGALGSGSAHAGSRTNLALSILATAVVAVAFQPVRERIQRLANRLVFGKRATPYEALSEFAGRMGGTYAAEDALPRMARVLAEGTGADRAVVWLKDGAELAAGACWPTAGEPPARVGFAGGGAPDIAGAGRVALVYYQGEALGALSVAKRPGENLTPVEGRLMADLAAQAGLLLHNIGLTQQLRARLADLQASRLRIVTAADDQRRRIERDIHDGAQQQLLAIASTLALAESVAGQDERRERALVTQLKAETSGALETLRDLARGIYPPLLADLGLAAAISAQAGKAPGPVQVSTGGLGRYPAEIETAVYFCCVEALHNAARHAPGSALRISLAGTGQGLEFEVTDDGPGFDPAAVAASGLRNMSDRLAALGGSCQVDSSPGRGTTVTGRIGLADQMAGNARAVPLTGRVG